jgi:uncharacterized protein YgbK (DUF1537 family)
MKIAVIADDLTGANDTGAKFAGKGLKTVVCLKPDASGIEDYPVVVVDTDSRSVHPESAYELTKLGIQTLLRQKFNLFYKKIDSTMRGNIGAEFDAVYDTLRPRFIFFTPAFPAQHRTVRNGCLYVGDRPLHETEFASDPRSPAKDAFVPRIVESQSKRKVGLISAAEWCAPERLASKLEQFEKEDIAYVLFDASTERDLHRVAEWGKRQPYFVVWAGSAGLADALLPATNAPALAFVRLSASPVLCVSGSVHPQTRRQVQILSDQPNVVNLRLGLAEVLAGGAVLEKEIRRIADEADQAVRERRDLLLCLAEGPGKANTFGRDGAIFGEREISDRIADALGFAAAEILRTGGIDRLVLTGGDTARRVCFHADMCTYEILSEVEPGVPFGKLRGDRGNEKYAVTKAGGFGTDQTLLRAVAAIKGVEVG